MSYKIMLADDHKLVRSGLKKIIDDEADLSVVAEAGNGQEVLELLDKIDVDLIIMDFNMPILNGIETTIEIRKRGNETKILLLTMHESEVLVMDGLSAGINGFLYKDDDIDELLLAVKNIISGKDYFNEEIKEKILNFHRSNKKFDSYHELSKAKIPLTKREMEIVTLIGKGLNSSQIGEKLFISSFTVIKHRKNILKKLGFKNFAEVVLYLKENKLI